MRGEVGDRRVACLLRVAFVDEAEPAIAGLTAWCPRHPQISSWYSENAWQTVGMPSQLATSEDEMGLFHSLPKAPSAHSLTVRKLIGRVHEGAVRVPRFQRPLRWKSQDVLKLFDSILKGYPIGALLFWKRQFSAGVITIGKASVEVPAAADGWYIVDGQQRTTALAASLLELSQAGDQTWELYFNPEKNRFLSAESSEADLSRHVPLRALGDIRRLGRWLRDCQLTEDQQSHVEFVQQRLLDYEIPAYVVETEEEDALRGVFARLNSTGSRMRADEVFQALLGGSASAPLATRRLADLEALQAAADVDGFGQPPRTEMLKALLAMSGLDPSRKLDGLGDAAIAKLVGPDDAEEAVRRTVSFIQAGSQSAEPGCGIPAYAFIPYPIVFVLLARWFHLFPEPEPAIRRGLAQWVWRGIATGVHQRAAVSAMRLQVREIRGGAPGDSLRSLLKAVGEPDGREWKLERFHANHAASRVELLALLSREPRTPLGGVSWRALLTSGARVAREVFALPRLQGIERELGQTAANRVLLDAGHTGLQAEFRRWSWDKQRDAFESHLIDSESLKALHENRRIDFLERRAARIRALVSPFIAQKAGLGQPIILPVQTYWDLGRDRDEQ